MFVVLAIMTIYCSASYGQHQGPRGTARLLELIPNNHDKLTKAIELNGPITESEARIKLLEKALESRDWKSAVILLDKKHSGSIDHDLDRFIEMVWSAPKAAEDSMSVEVLKRLYKSKIQYLERKKKMLEEYIPNHGCEFPIPSEPV